MAARKVRVTVTVTVDPDEWATDNGIVTGEVRQDIRDYVANLVQQSYGGSYFRSVEVA